MHQMDSFEESEVKRVIKDVALSRGVLVNDIPTEKKKKRPDFEFLCDGELSIVELKQREADWFLTRSQEAALKLGQIVHKSESLGFHQTFADRIAYSSIQLNAYAPADTFRLVWYFAYGNRSRIASDRIKTTLLGNVPVASPDTCLRYEALFFDKSLFLQEKETLDGAFVSFLSDDQLSVQLLLNPYASSYCKLRCSKIATAFSDGIFDPLAAETSEGVLIVDELADRSSERAMLSLLEAKYGITRLQTLRMGHMSAIAASPIE